MKFQKPPISVLQQVAKLQSRGLQVDNPAEAEHYLRFIGYYRLSAYALPLQLHQNPTKPFKPGVSFQDILNIYRFDRELRLLTMDAIERVEVAIRSVIVNEMCLRHGSHWLMDATHFNPTARNFKHHLLLDKIDQEFSIPPQAKAPTRPHHEVFINHYFSKYKDPYLPPVWMTAETLTLGSWSVIFENLRVANERKAVATHFQVDEQVLRSWLHALTHIRNLCAHHSRLWNRQMVIKFIVAKKHRPFLAVNDRFYAVAVVLHDLMQIVAPGTGWHIRLRDLLVAHPFIDLHAMGFPKDWEKEPFWGF